jgi:hypothetical protein
MAVSSRTNAGGHPLDLCWRVRFQGDGPEGWDTLVAGALHRVEFRAYPKGSQDKYLGVWRNGFNS